MVAGTHIRDPGPNRKDGTRPLMAEDGGNRLIEGAVGEREVGVADTGGRQAHMDLALGRRGKMDLFDYQRRADRPQNGTASHGCLIRRHRSEALHR